MTSATNDVTSSSTAFSPVFVVGCERSGTTLLAVLLGRHSALAMTPETHFFRLVGKRRKGRGESHEELLRRFYANRTSAELGLDAAALAQRFATRSAGYPSLLRSVMEEFAANDGKPRAGEKTPLHLLNVAAIVEWYPEARIICILRDGRDVVLSLKAMPWAEERRLRPLSWRWVQLLRLAERWRTQYPENFMMIQYEDLLRAPDATLRRVDVFAGLAFEQGQLQAGADVHVVDEASEPWKADALHEIDPARIAGWRRKADPAQIRAMNSLMGPMLRKYGYPETECRRTIGDYVALAWFKSGLFYLWTKLVEKHLPSARARRRAARLRDQGCA